MSVDFALRDYQQEAEDCVFFEWETKTSTLVVAATGTGKTVLFATIIKRLGKRAIVLAHIKELIWQARTKIMNFTGMTVAVEMGDVHANQHAVLWAGEKPADVIVSTRQTQTSGMDGKGRMTKFNPLDFDLLIIDECHRSASDSYRRIIDYYTKGNPAMKVLGVTATPDRADEKALGEIFQSVAFKYELDIAIKNGWLVYPEQRMIHVDGLDFSSIRTTAGDLNGADLAAVMEAEAHVQRMVQATFEAMFDLEENSMSAVDPALWADVVHGYTPKTTLAFTSSVKGAEMFAAIFNRIIPAIATWVCGETDDAVREEANKDFASGKIRLLANCGTHTEGYDNPLVEIVVMGRPTKSRALYCQCIGRGTRALPGVVDGPATAELRKAAIAASAKPRLLVLDFVGNAGRHKLMTTADILGGKTSEEVKKLALAKTLKKAMRICDAIAEVEAEREAAAEAARQAEAARKAKVIARAAYKTTSVNPFSILDIHPQPEHPSERGLTVPEKQRQWLRNAGVDPDTIPYSQQKQLVGEIVGRWKNGQCSIKQAKILKRHGFPTNLTMTEAKVTLDKISASGWKLRGPIATPAQATAPTPQHEMA